ncbi:hypothetical protein SmJEL517_g03855 [Synchytrium microbalum]|uniref:Uncharacterized protein n=1 Tax=Synchytrium microbalum TaxID=1806994 RepID=A0A507C2B9_9FUNG|nr:uncharacterized protein SmJEL517_g03855 [Synchytrium microbalum]TPX33199.1 hypothetical protein SmJEL517_g03855 [Synchytrium microbalum]
MLGGLIAPFKPTLLVEFSFRSVMVDREDVTPRLLILLGLFRPYDHGRTSLVTSLVFNGPQHGNLFYSGGKNPFDPVHVSKFLPLNTHVLTASDDRTVRYWDISTEAVNGKITSCNYGTSVKTSVLTLDRGYTVKCVLPFKNGGMVAFAGGDKINTSGAMAGGRPVQTISSSQKAETCLAFDGTSTRLVSGHLDHHVKVYNLQDYKVVISIKYPAPILCVSFLVNSPGYLSFGRWKEKRDAIHTTTACSQDAKDNVQTLEI